MIDYRSGLWNDWFGGDRPVMGDDLVEFLTHDHLEKSREANIMYGDALEFDWIDDPSDIVKFRVIKKRKSKMKFKVGDRVVVKNNNPYRSSEEGEIGFPGTVAYVTKVLGHGCQLALDSDCDPDEHSGRSLFFLNGQFEPYTE